MRYIHLLILAFLATACEKVIDIDLNNSDPRVVIEGRLSDQPGECEVLITRTLNFDDTVGYPLLGGAQVLLRDLSTGSIAALTEVSLGRYTNPSLAGISGRGYELVVSLNGQQYTARGAMPPRVELDSLLIDSTNFTGPRGPANPDGTRRVLLLAFPFFTEPIGQTNQYYFEVSQNDTLADSFFLYNDLGADGQPMLRPVFVSTWERAQVIINLQCIDAATYEYLNGLNLNLGQNSATPANPKGNFDNGALGHFRVHTTSKKTFVVN